MSKVNSLVWVTSVSLTGLKLTANDCFGNEFARLDLRSKTKAEIKKFKRTKQAAFERIILSTLSNQPSGEAVAWQRCFVIDGVWSSWSQIQCGKCGGKGTVS